MALVKPGHDTINIATAGTRVPLSATQKIVISLQIQADPANAGVIYIGDSTVSSSSKGVALAAGNSQSIEMPSMGQAGSYEFDLSQIYVDAANNNEDVHILYYVRG